MTAVPQSEPTGVDDGVTSDVSTRDRLLVAAYELLIINGYQATTLQAVARRARRDRAPSARCSRRAGLTTGAIYAHFGGKQELMAHAVLDEWYRTDRETLNEYLAAHVDSEDRRGAMRTDPFTLLLARHVAAPDRHPPIKSESDIQTT